MTFIVANSRILKQIKSSSGDLPRHVCPLPESEPPSLLKLIKYNREPLDR